MKANEAPEKLYVHVKKGKVLNVWNSEWVGVNDIEYVRKDAFIEKACEYLQINLWRVVNEEPDFRQRFVTDFRYYMKGK